MKKYLFNAFFTLLILSTLSTELMAQGNFTITGKVIDKSDNTPLIGVSVTETDQEQRVVNGTITDVNGNFSLRINDPKNKLNFTIIGYKSIKGLSIGNKSSFKVPMQPSSKRIQTVEITAQEQVSNGMLPIDKRDLTTAISSIDAKELETMQAPSIALALEGRLPGADIIANSGDPGSGMKIRIRETSSINSSDNPLIVVDGMPYETEIPSDFNFGTADVQGYATLLNLAPTDIKTITILKDASATALWGSRAAGGVLVITTKRGVKGKPRVNYTFKGSIQLKPKQIPMLSGDQYSSLIPEEFMNVNGIPLNTENIKEFTYDPNNPDWYYNYSNNTDWINAVTQTGNTQEHTVSLRGGGDKALYYASVDYLYQKGTTKGTDLSRITARLNLDYHVSEKIKLKANISFANTSNHRSYNSNVRNIAYRKMPNMSIYEYDDQGNKTPILFSPESNIQGQYSSTYNPVAMATKATNKIKMERITPNLEIQYAIVPGIWKLKTNVQFDISNTKNKKFLPEIVSGRPWTDNVVNQAYDGDNDVFRVQTKSQIIYTPHFDNPKNSLVGLINIMTSDEKGISYQAQTSNSASSVLKDPSIQSLDNGSASKLAATGSEYRAASALINAQYKYDDKYMINVGLRGDGTSRLASSHRFGLFPSVSGRWRISKESFMKRFEDKLDELSLRLSYGHSGRAPGSNYSFYHTYNVVGWSYLDEGGVYPDNMKLKQLRWETLKGTNLGLNLIMFDRRLNVDMEFYRNKTTDLYFSDLQISSVNGYGSLSANVGTLINQGWEVDIHSTPFKRGNWKVKFNLNFARNVNMLTKLSKYFPNRKGDFTKNGEYISLLQANNPFGSIYGFRYKGVYRDEQSTIATNMNGKPIIDPEGNRVFMTFNYPQIGYIFQPGDAKYEDINHDGTINDQDIVYLGNSNPMITGGFGINLSYKEMIKLTSFFNFRYKYDVVNGTKMQTTNMYGYDNQSTAVLKRWRKSGDITNMPRALYATGYNWLGSDRYVEDASFLRFRAVTMRFYFPNQLIKKWEIQSLSCYLTCENVFTWTKYTGQDPAVGIRGSDPFRIAKDNSRTPPPLMFTLGLTASF